MPTTEYCFVMRGEWRIEWSIQNNGVLCFLSVSLPQLGYNEPNPPETITDEMITKAERAVADNIKVI